MRAVWVSMGLIVALALSPRLATAQCSMGGGAGGGHDHGAATSAQSRKSSEKKTRQAIDRLLAEPESRALLMEAVLADAALVRGLVDRMAAAPEWRAFAAKRLAAAPVNPAPARPESASVTRPAPAPGPEVALYRCPMHREVTSSRPGNCPKCGMALRRET